jgi:hypothetical protein
MKRSSPGDELSHLANDVNNADGPKPFGMRALAHRKRRSAPAAFRFVAIGALALELLLASVSSPSARSLSDAERRALGAQVAAFEKAFSSNDFDMVIATIPPKLMAAIAAKAGVTVERLKQAMSAQMKEGLAKVKFLNFRLDFAGANFRETADGTPYAIVPTFMLADIDNHRVEIKSSTLGFMDEGKWYLLRLENPGMTAILQQVYPFLEKVELPRESMREVQ